jgi:lipopolysaccharide export system protein LptA
MLGAIPADDALPITISSNGFHYDNIKGVAVYTGDVIAIQGSRKLTGDTLELIRNEKGNIAHIIMHGRPAQHQALTDITKPLLFAKANTIAYDPLAKYLTLTDNAWISQAGDEYTAPTIEYDVALQAVKSRANAQGRTTIILQPRPKEPI